MTFGLVTSVEADMLGSALLTDAALGDTVLAVEFAGDFNEDGGQLLLNENVLDYVSVDNDADTITLAAPLPVVAEADDPVQMIDAGSPAVEWVANVAIDEGDTVAATIPTPLIGYFPEGTYDQPMTVEIELHNGSYDVVSQPTRDASLDGGAVWNPHVFADIGGTTIPDSTAAGYSEASSWLGREANGVEVAGNGYRILYPGVYFMSVQIAFGGSTVGKRRARILVNGAVVTFMAITPDPSVVDYVNISREVRLEVNDLVTVEMWQDSGGDLSIGLAAGASNFAMHRVSV